MGGYAGVVSTYTPIEYIQTTGTQYINTGITGTWSNTLQFKSKFLFTQMVPNAEQTFIGNKNASNQGTTLYVTTNTSNLGSWCGSGTAYQIGTFTVGIENNIDITYSNPVGRSGTYNGSSFNNTTVANNYTSNTDNIAIFSSKSTTLDTPAYMKLYTFQIIKDGVLVRDFVPVLDENGVACLYDNVEEQAYYNMGTGTFTAGNATGGSNITTSKARKITKAYIGINSTFTPVEYIESTGTQYINIGIMQSDIGKVEAQAYNTFGLVYDNKTYGGSLFGARVSSTNSVFQYASGAYGDFVGNGTSQVTPTKNTNTDLLTLNYTKTSYSITCGNYSASGSLNVTIATPKEAYLFGMNNNGVLAPGTWKIKTFKIYDLNNELVRDYIPALDENNVACLFDKVENKPYYNKGTGTFTAGNTTGEPNIVVPFARKIIAGYVGVNDVARKCYSAVEYTPLNYIQSTGTQYIDTGISGNGIGSFEIKMRTLGTDANSYSQYFAGVKNAVTAKLYRNANNVQIAWSGASVGIWNYSNTNDHIIEVKAPNVIVDGAVISSTYNGYAWSSPTYYIFNAHEESSLKSNFRLYYLKMWTDNVLVRDFIPVLDKNNVPCLYDKVSETYFYNAGTGTFLYG